MRTASIDFNATPRLKHLPSALDSEDGRGNEFVVIAAVVRLQDQNAKKSKRRYKRTSEVFGGDELAVQFRQHREPVVHS